MNIAIAGFGQEGRASYEYWNVDGNQLTIVDEREQVDGLPDGVPTILGADAFSKLSDFDLIIRSPSINPHKLPYGEKVWSATNEFFAKCPAEIIGVTGTKGKGTTSSLIASILNAAGKTVHLVGNIGTPALTELPKIQPDDLVVFELSSFQLWDLKKSPHVAVVLMIEPDHLDIHSDMDDYVSAKTNIIRFQSRSDRVVFHANNERSREIATQSNAGIRTQYPFELSDDVRACINLPGEHNVDNACAAIAAVETYVDNMEAIKTGLNSFSGLPHRLKFVATKNGVKFYDDSIATTPGSAIAAIRSFDEATLLILGGQDKGGDYGELMRECRERQVSVLAIGANRERLAELCAQNGVEYGTEPGDMRSIVHRAAMESKQGSVVLLSPASASFDMFKSYADRGDQFIAAVNSL